MELENSAQSNGVKAVDTLAKVLTEIGWEAKRDVVTAGFVVEFDPPYIPLSTAFAAVAIESEQFMFFLNIGVAVPPDRVDEVARFLTRANWALTIGNFEMDYDDGHVRFKSGINFRGAELSEALIRNAILSAMNAVERYADALINVLANRKDAAEALKELEEKAN
jgi:hypothetical protein